MGSLHDVLTTGLAWLLVLGALLHAYASWRRLDRKSTEFVWSISASLAALLIAVIHLLLIHRRLDAGLALLATVGALAWAAVAQAYGRAIKNRYDLRVLWHLGCALGLAPLWLPWRPVLAMGASGFWIALIVGLTIAAVALSALLRRVASERLT